jgi:hypothetical protein
MQRTNFGVLLIVIVAAIMLQGCNNKTIIRDEFPLIPGLVPHTDQHYYSSAKTYPCSFIHYLDSLYCSNDTVSLKSILDTVVIINNNLMNTDSSTNNYPNPFSTPPGLKFSVGKDSDLVTIFVTNEKKSFVSIYLNAKLPEGIYWLIWNDNDTCQKFLETGTYIVDVVAGEQKIQQKMTLLR